MKQNKLAFVIIIVSMMMTMTSVTHAQDRIERIGDKEYQLLNDQWFYLTEQADTVRFSPERLIVRLKENAGEITHFKHNLQLSDLEVAAGPTSGGFYVLHIPTTNRGFEVKRTLKANDDVETVEFSIYGKRMSIPNDDRWSDQWNLPQVNMSKTWQITKGNSDVVVGIIDSGAQLNHPDLQNCIWSGVGYNFLNPGLPPNDIDSHGTMVSGIAGAETNNSIGVAGVSGCWDSSSGARLMILKDGDQQPDVFLSSQAIEWAADNGAIIINMSTGYSANSGVLQSAVNYATNLGVTIVASAGNNGGDTSNDKSIRYPAKYSNTIAVGATVEDDTRWIDTNLLWQGSAIGPELDLMAPGGAPIIWTTGLNSSYTLFGGTSASAPHVAGVAGLMKSVNPNLTPAQVRTILQNTADWKSYMNSNEYGHGRLNTYSAVKHALPLQFENHAFTSSQTLTQKAHLFGNATVSSGSTLTIAADNVAVIDGSLTSSGSTTAHLVIEGRLIAEPNASLSGIRLTVADGGEVLLRDDVSLDTDGSRLLVSSNGQLTASEGFDLDMNGGMVNINGQADFGEQFSMSDGSISGGNSSELRIGSNSTLTFSPPCTGFKCIAGEGSLYSQGTVELDGAAGQGITLSAANAQVGGWSGMLLSGTAVTDPVLNNVTITQARNGLSLVNVDDLHVEGINLSISDSEFDGLRLINADLSWLSGLNWFSSIELNQNGRHGMWTDGAYVDYMSNIDLQDNTGAGLWAESGGWLEQGTNFAITGNTQNGIYTTGSVTLEITDSPIHGNSPRDANANGSSTQLITNNWWGQAPPAASQHYEGPFAQQTIAPWQTSNTFPSSVAARQPDVRVGSQAKTRQLDAFRALHHSELSSTIAGLPRQQQTESWITALDALLLEQSYTAVTELGQTLMAEAAEQAQPWGVAIGRRVLVARLMLGQHEAAAATLQWLDERRDGEAAPGHLYELLTLMAPAGADGGTEPARPVAARPAASLQASEVRFSNYPNPFNPTTMLSWELPEAGHVRVQVYDVNGRRVATLTDGPRQPGTHSLRFDAANLASGMYFARMELAGQVFTRPMLLVK